MELWHTINLKMTEMKFNLAKKKKIICYKKYKSQEVEDPKKFIFLYSTKCVTKNKLLMIE